MNTLQRYASTLRSCSDQQRILIILIVVVYNAEYALPAFHHDLPFIQANNKLRVYSIKSEQRLMLQNNESTKRSTLPHHRLDDGRPKKAVAATEITWVALISTQ